MTTMVCVLDRKDRPLMPCHPARARKMLKKFIEEAALGEPVLAKNEAGVLEDRSGFLGTQNLGPVGCITNRLLIS